MTTRLAELNSYALHLADAEAFANEAVHVHVAHGDLPARLSRFQSDVLDDLGCDERQRLAGRGSTGMEMAIAFQPLARDGMHGLNRPQLGLARSSEMDRLHRHDSMMHQRPVVESLEDVQEHVGGR
jgi:hypothetical protein